MARALTILKMSFFSNLKKDGGTHQFEGWAKHDDQCVGCAKAHLETRNFIRK